MKQGIRCLLEFRRCCQVCLGIRCRELPDDHLDDHAVVIFAVRHDRRRERSSDDFLAGIGQPQYFSFDDQAEHPRRNVEFPLGDLVIKQDEGCPVRPRALVGWDHHDLSLDRQSLIDRSTPAAVLGLSLPICPTTLLGVLTLGGSMHWYRGYGGLDKDDGSEGRFRGGVGHRMARSGA